MPRASAVTVHVGGKPFPATGSPDALGARGCAPLAFFLPFTVVNTKNALTNHWSAKGAYTRRLRGMVHIWCHATALRAKWNEPASSPKRIHLAATVGRLMDSTDGLRVALAPALDGLGPCAHRRGGPRCNHAYLIETDADAAGHVVTYSQRIGRPRGVAIAVTPLLTEARD